MEGPQLRDCMRSTRRGFDPRSLSVFLLSILVLRYTGEMFQIETLLFSSTTGGNLVHRPNQKNLMHLVEEAIGG